MSRTPSRKWTDCPENGQQQVNKDINLNNNTKEESARVKNIYGGFKNVFLTKEERSELDEQYGAEFISALIESLSVWFTMNPSIFKARKDRAILTLKSWALREKNKNVKPKAEPASARGVVTTVQGWQTHRDWCKKTKAGWVDISKMTKEEIDELK